MPNLASQTRNIEDKLQESIHCYLQRALKKPAFHFAVPNGKRRIKRDGAALKRQGVLAGVADFLICGDSGKVYYIELKRPKLPICPAGTQNPAQKDFEKLAIACGAPYAVAHSIEEVQALLIKWDLYNGFFGFGQ